MREPNSKKSFSFPMTYAPHSSHRRRTRTYLQQQAHLPRSLRPPIPHPWRLRPQHPLARSASPNREITAQAIGACIKQKFSLAARPTAPTPACAVATRAEVSLSGPASCSCSSRARSSGAALPPLELRRAWHARGRWPPAEVGRAGARWQGMQAGGGAGRQAGASARKNGARICPCRRRPRCRVVDGCGTAAGAGILRNRLSMLVSFCRPRFPRLRAVLAGARCSPAGGARRRRRAMLGLTAPWTSHVRAEACRTPIPTGALELWKRDTHGDEMQH